MAPGLLGGAVTQLAPLNMSRRAAARIALFSTRAPSELDVSIRLRAFASHSSLCPSLRSSTRCSPRLLVPPCRFQSQSAAAAASMANMERVRQIHAARNRNLLLYTSAVIIIGVGVTYAAVPLYRAFCSATGFGGTPMTAMGKFSADRLHAVPSAKRIKVHFNADHSSSLEWSFTPQQKFVTVVPGETALAFYTAKNVGKEDVIGIATYNVTPGKIAPYFAKVECFCFEEQKLRAGEEVDMPLLFFIDRDFADDPQMRDIDDVVLSYTFFKARRTEKGHLVPDAPVEVVEAASGFADYELAKKKHGETVQ